MSNEYAEVKLNPSINHGNATVCGTEKGWMLPGCREVRSEAEAKMMAIRMARLMKSVPEEVIEKQQHRKIMADNCKKVKDTILEMRGE